MDGIINLLKPSGMTSHDCVYALRKISGEKKIGHSGTLDPNACGVLPLFVGKATRLIEYTESATKSYRCEMLLGVTTDTQDIWGNVLKNNRSSIGEISEEAVETAFLGFLGNIEQVPPHYSAVKVNGKRLYHYAREGKSVEVDARQITVNQMNLLSFEKEEGRVLFDIECSKGTYVRTICNDVGTLLKCGACMSFLLRTATSGFHLDQSMTLQELANLTHNEFENKLLPATEAVKSLKRIDLNAEDAVLFLHGNKTFQRNLSPPSIVGQEDKAIFAMFSNNKFLGIAEYEKNGEYRATKVFNE